MYIPLSYIYIYNYNQQTGGGEANLPPKRLHLCCLEQSFELMGFTAAESASHPLAISAALSLYTVSPASDPAYPRARDLPPYPPPREGETLPPLPLSPDPTPPLARARFRGYSEPIKDGIASGMLPCGRPKRSTSRCHKNTTPKHLNVTFETHL